MKRLPSTALALTVAFTVPAGEACGAPMPNPTPNPTAQTERRTIELGNGVSVYDALEEDLRKTLPTVHVIRVGTTVVFSGPLADVEIARSVVRGEIEKFNNPTPGNGNAASPTGSGRGTDRLPGAEREHVSVLVPLQSRSDAEILNLARSDVRGVSLIPIVRPSGPEFQNLPKAYRDTNVLLQPGPGNGSLVDIDQSGGTGDLGRTLDGLQTARQQARTAAHFGTAARRAAPTLGRVYTYDQFRQEQGRREPSPGAPRRAPLPDLRGSAALPTRASAADRAIPPDAGATAVTGFQPGVLITGPRALVEDAVRVFLADAEEPDQVVVEARVLELTDEAIRSVGVRWADENGRILTAPVSITESKPTDLSRFGSFNRTGFQFSAKVQALMSRGLIKVRANPSLLIQSGKQAEFFLGSGTTFKFTNGTGPNGVTLDTSGLGTAKTGVQLSVVPQVHSDYDTVTLRINSSIGAASTNPPPDLPNFSLVNASRFRQAETTVYLRNEGIVAIGGLTNDEDVQRVDKVPLLGQIPLIGQLFTFKNRDRRQSEVVVLLGVRIQPRGTTGQPEKDALESKAQLFGATLDSVRLDKQTLVGDGETELTGWVRLAKPAHGDVPVDLDVDVVDQKDLKSRDQSDVTVDFLDELHRLSPQVVIPDGQQEVRFSLRAQFAGAARTWRGRVRATLNGETQETPLTIRSSNAQTPAGASR